MNEPSHYQRLLEIFRELDEALSKPENTAHGRVLRDTRDKLKAELDRMGKTG